MTTSNNKKHKARIRLVLVLAAALGSSSATLSGVLATLALQTNTAVQANIA